MKWNVVGRIAHGGNPFTSFGDGEWCDRCRLVVDTETQAHHRNGIYTYKRWCLRCGKIVKHGSYAAPIVADQALPPAAVAFATKSESVVRRTWSGGLVGSV